MLWGLKRAMSGYLVCICIVIFICICICILVERGWWGSRCERKNKKGRRPRRRWVGHTWFPFVSQSTVVGPGWDVVGWRGVKGGALQRRVWAVTYHIYKMGGGVYSRTGGKLNVARAGGTLADHAPALDSLREPLYRPLPCQKTVCFGCICRPGQSFNWNSSWQNYQQNYSWKESIKISQFCLSSQFGPIWRHFHSRPQLLRLVLCLHQTVLNSHLSLKLFWWQDEDGEHDQDQTVSNSHLSRKLFW